MDSSLGRSDDGFLLPQSEWSFVRQIEGGGGSGAALIELSHRYRSSPGFFCEFLIEALAQFQLERARRALGDLTCRPEPLPGWE